MSSENFAEIFFDRALNRPRSPEVRKPLACFLILFARRKKNVKTSPSQGVPRFSKPQISTPQPPLRSATIKTFFKKIRGFANLESANQNSKFVQTKLNPFSALRRYPCRDSTLRVLSHRLRRYYPCCCRNNFCRFAAFAGGKPPCGHLRCRALASANVVAGFVP